MSSSPSEMYSIDFNKRERISAYMKSLNEFCAIYLIFNYVVKFSFFFIIDLLVNNFILVYWFTQIIRNMSDDDSIGDKVLEWRAVIKKNFRSDQLRRLISDAKSGKKPSEYKHEDFIPRIRKFLN